MKYKSEAVVFIIAIILCSATLFLKLMNVSRILFDIVAFLSFALFCYAIISFIIKYSK